MKILEPDIEWKIIIRTNRRFSTISVELLLHGVVGYLNGSPGAQKNGPLQMKDEEVREM